jgi:Ca-activated chloride channel family protein
MVAEFAAIAVLLLALLAEALHARRIRRLARLAFGPRERPSAWARFAPLLRVAAYAAVTWALVTLLFVEPQVYHADDVMPGKEQHVMIVYDVSPSMRLEDAGPSHTQTRKARARDVMRSFFDRVPIEQYLTSVVAVYNGAKPVVVETKDREVVDAIMGDLPLYQAFDSGETRLFDGLEEAARIAKPWNPRSTTLILVSDGDTVPAQGMPSMPAAIGKVLVVGVGDPLQGSFIAGHQSRQDTSTLRQIATRLGGTYHNGNELHLSSDLIREIVSMGQQNQRERWTRREYALLTAGLGALALAALPWLLHHFGTSWQPGVRQPTERPVANVRNRTAAMTTR